MNRNSLTARMFLVSLAFLMLGGCAGKDAPPSLDRMFALVEDPLFVADLGRAGTRGLAGIRVVAPSSGFGEAGGRRARAMAEKLGISFPEEALAAGRVPYNANSDAVRLRLLAEALADPKTEIIWAARGGYGASRLLEGLDRLPRDSVTKKIVVGYSDITFLHLYFQKLGWKTVHGALFGEMAARSKDERNFRLLAELLSGRLTELRYDGLEPCNEAARRLMRPVRAVLTGGNLTCIAAAEGTPWAVEAAGKILFLEDVKEQGYKIDRMLTQLRMAGKLETAAAILLGSFTAGDRFTAYALERFAGECPVPVFRTDQFGHGPRNYPLVFNAPAELGRQPGGGAFRLSIRVDQLP